MFNSLIMDVLKERKKLDLALIQQQLEDVYLSFAVQEEDEDEVSIPKDLFLYLRFYFNCSLVKMRSLHDWNGRWFLMATLSIIINLLFSYYLFLYGY